jgi:Rrf2 family transcriptional regulator, nitric oxide-sensitive transcriptional repressor
VRLTQWTDYSLRVLMYCAATQGREALPTVAEIAQAHGISHSHLTKIVMTLAAQGWLETLRGRGGGLRLLVPAGQVSVGDVVRQTEADFQLVECFDATGNTCRMGGRCHLQSVLGQAMDAYLAVLDGVTLADLVAPATSARVRWVPGLPDPALLSARPLAG